MSPDFEYIYYINYYFGAIILHNTKLFLILSSLTPHELKELGKYISSPFHNSNKALIRFYNLLKKHYPDFVSRTLEIENTHKKLFPGKKFNSAVMRNLISEMIQITEEYLALINFKNDALETKKHLLKELQTRNIEKLFEKNIEEANKILENSKVRDEYYYANKYELESIRRTFYELKVPVGKRRLVHGILPDEIENLTYAFFIQILREYFSLYNVQSQLNFEYGYKFFDEIMNHIEREKQTYEKVPMIYILHSFLSLFIRGGNEELIPTLKEMIDKNMGIMNKEDFDNFYTELYNYYKHKQFLGDKSFGRKSFELIKEMLKKDVFIKRGNIMTDHAYTNIVHAAVRERELEWAEDFNSKYKNRVSMFHRENAFSYNIAVINYMKGFRIDDTKQKKQYYDKALEYLAKVKSEDFYYMTRIKNLLVKIYYELKDFEHAKGIIASYKQYLTKNKIIPKDLYQRYMNFINFANKLIKIGTDGDFYASSQLKKQITESNNTEYKGWLIERLREIEIRNAE